MIELITSLAYDLVEASWHASAAIVKFYLVFAAARLYSNGKLDKKNLRETLIDDSKTVVPVIALIGAATLAIGYELRPSFELLSELTALIYLGYLFWEF